MIAGSRNGEVVLAVRELRASVDGAPVLDGVSFEVVDRIREGRTTGQVAAVLGPSGVGKTTLLRILAGLDPMDRGAVIGPGGAPLAIGSVGLVFQDYPLFAHRTVEQNLRLAGRIGGMDEARAADRTLELLRRVGLSDRAGAWPSQLSGGERQRVAIAQQLVLPRRVLLLDEPFSGLDPRAVAEVAALVREVADEHELNTVIIVTHDVRAALATCDTLFLLGRGPKHGARVHETFDLVELGFAWEAGARDPRGLAELDRAVSARFQSL